MASATTRPPRSWSAGKREVLAASVDLDEPGPDVAARAPSAPAKETDFTAEADVLTAAAQGRLKSFIERIERLEEDKAAISGDLKEVYAEAKGEGFDPKIMRKVVRLRKTHKVKPQEEQALIHLYLTAIGRL